MNEYFTAPQVAEKFKVTSRTVRRWIQAGRLSGLLVNGRWYVSDVALEVFLCCPLHVQRITGIKARTVGELKRKEANATLQ